MEKLHAFIREQSLDEPDDKVIARSFRVANLWNVHLMSVLEERPGYLPEGVYIIPQVSKEVFESKLFEKLLTRDINGLFTQQDDEFTVYTQSLEIVQTGRTIKMFGQQCEVLQVQKKTVD